MQFLLFLSHILVIYPISQHRHVDRRLFSLQNFSWSPNCYIISLWVFVISILGPKWEYQFLSKPYSLYQNVNRVESKKHLKTKPEISCVRDELTHSRSHYFYFIQNLFVFKPNNGNRSETLFYMYLSLSIYIHIHIYVSLYVYPYPCLYLHVCVYFGVWVRNDLLSLMIDVTLDYDIK